MLITYLKQHFVLPKSRILLTISAFLMAGAAILTSPAAWPRTLLDLDTNAQPILLFDWGDYWIDTTGALNVEQVGDLNTVNWMPTQKDRIYPITGGQSLWIRLTVPPAPDNERWYAEIPDPSINRVSLYSLDSAGQWTEERAGALTAVSQWPVPHRHPLLPISLSAEVPTRYLLRLENEQAFSAPLQFISERQLSYGEQKVSLILGIFFGLAGLAAIVSALAALSLRDTAYGFYAVCVVLMGLTHAALTGLGGLYLWPNWPWWNDISVVILPLLTASATLMFASAAVAMSERSAGVYRLMLAITVLGVLAALGALFVPPGWRTTGSLYAMVGIQTSGILGLVWAWRRGDRFAPWLALSYLPVIGVGLWAIARSAGLVPIGFLTQYGLQAGAAINLPFIMVILMLRSQHRRENTRRIQGLDRVDPATGLINGHVFAERLIRMIARSDRLKQLSAVMLIDLINTDQTQRDFGRKAADELPLRVAERLLSTAREIDSAARLSERRFGMLVEGPFTDGDAATLGPRIVARCLMPYKGMHIDCVAQVRVAYALVPHQGSNAQGLLNRLEERLAAAPPDDKKAVFMLNETAPETVRPRRRSEKR